MNQLQTFNHSMFGEFPVLVVDGVEWFGATEAAKALSFSDPHKAITNHVDEDDSTVHPVIDSLGRKQRKKFINESGLYSLIFGAAKQGNNPEIKEKAKQFKRWVTSEVLPSIRKHGAYMTPETIEKALLNPDVIINLATKLKEEQQKRQQLEAKIEQDEPYTNFGKAIASSEASITIGSFAKLLYDEHGIEIGRNRLFEWLRNNGYLIKSGREKNQPKQQYVEQGLFETTVTLKRGPRGYFEFVTTLITGKGQVEITKKLLKEFGVEL